MKKLWFKDKEYGWGWRPQTWEGWAVTALFIGLLALRTTALVFSLRADPTPFAFFEYGVDILVLVALLFVIAFLTGEKPTWRWGGKKVSSSFALEQTCILMFFLLVTYAVGFLGSNYTVIDTWYAFLAKPALTPPDWVFPVVWSVLYLFMGLAAYFAWYHIRAHRVAILALYAVNLFLNALWSYTFFGLKDIASSVLVIFLLDIVVLVLTIRFLTWWRPSGYLFMPYLAWVLFATYINISIFLLN